MGAGQRGEVDVRHAVAVGGEERRAADAVGDRVDPPPGRRVDAGVDALDPHAPGPVRARGERLDQLGAVAGEQQHALHALGGVERDDVPDDRQPAHLDERLRDRARVLLQARPTPAAQDHGGVGAETAQRPRSAFRLRSSQARTSEIGCFALRSSQARTSGRRYGGQLHPSAHRDPPAVGGPGVQLRALPLADHDVAPDQPGELERGGAGRLVLLDADAVREHPRAHPAGGLVLPRPDREHRVAARDGERVDGGGARELLDVVELRPLAPRADPGQTAVRPGRDLAGGRTEHVDGRAGVREQPRRADQRVAGQRQLDGRREDVQRARGGVVDEHGLGEAQVGCHRLAAVRRHGRTVEDHAERVPAAAVGAEEDAQDVERGRAHVADRSSHFARAGGRQRLNASIIASARSSTASISRDSGVTKPSATAWSRNATRRA